MKQRQQRELAESLIAKVKKELENPKTLNSILQQSLADVESMFTSPPPPPPPRPLRCVVADVAVAVAVGIIATA